MPLELPVLVPFAVTFYYCEIALYSRTSDPGCKDGMYRSIVVKCSICDDLDPQTDGSNHSNQIDRPKLVAPNMFQPFLSLLSSEDKTVRLGK